MLRRHARELHLRIADEIERLDGSDGDAGDVLADHLYRADAGARAVNQLLRSAQRAEGVFANDTAILHLRRARELVLRDDETAPSAPELTLRLADLDRQSARTPKRGSCTDRCSPARRRCAPRAAWLRACGPRATTAMRSTVLDAARPGAPRRNGRRSASSAVVASWSPTASTPRSARSPRASPSSRPDDPMRATLLSDLARAESSVGLLEDALVHGLEARRSFEESGDLRRLSSALRVLGGVYEDLGRLDEAAAVLRDGLALSERIGHVEEAAGCLVNLALVELAAGEIDAAIDCNRRAIDELARDRASRAGDRECEPRRGAPRARRRRRRRRVLRPRDR